MGYSSIYRLDTNVVQEIMQRPEIMRAIAVLPLKCGGKLKTSLNLNCCCCSSHHTRTIIIWKHCLHAHAIPPFLQPFLGNLISASFVLLVII